MLEFFSLSKVIGVLLIVFSIGFMFILQYTVEYYQEGKLYYKQRVAKKHIIKTFLKFVIMFFCLMLFVNIATELLIYIIEDHSLRQLKKLVRELAKALKNSGVVTHL